MYLKINVPDIRLIPLDHLTIMYIEDRYHFLLIKSSKLQDQTIASFYSFPCIFHAVPNIGHKIL